MKPPAAFALLVALLSGRCGSSPRVAPAPQVSRDAAVDAGAAPDAAGVARYLALGDSFTIGTGSSPEQAFPARLAARWQSPRCRVELRNPAVNGYSTQDLLDRELPAVRPFAPTVVTLAVGANDVVRVRDLDAYRAQLRRIFDALADAGVPASRVVSIPQPDWARSPAAQGFGDAEQLRGLVAAYNDALRAETEARGGRYVDLFALMEAQAREGLIAADGLHASAPAHDAWAERLAAALPAPCAP